MRMQQRHRTASRSKGIRRIETAGRKLQHGDDLFPGDVEPLRDLVDGSPGFKVLENARNWHTGILKHPHRLPFRGCSPRRETETNLKLPCSLSFWFLSTTVGRRRHAQGGHSHELLRGRRHVRHVKQSQFLLEGQKHRKRGPTLAGSHAAGEMNCPFMLVDDATAHPKAQPRAFFTFGGEEGSEKILADPGRDACASVEYGYAYSPACRIGDESRFAQMQN